MLTVGMQSLEEPLSQEEIKKLHKLLEPEPLLGKMVERAVRGIRKSSEDQSELLNLLESLADSRKTSSSCDSQGSRYSV
jgi:hypothetical protein